MFDAGVEDSRDGPSKEDIPDEGAVGVAGKKTQDTISAVDSIIEALEMAESEADRLASYMVCILLLSDAEFIYRNSSC
jgi:U3 small nucleolar RNA-associated protein 12